MGGIMITKEMSGVRLGYGEARTLRLKKYKRLEVRRISRLLYKRAVA